MIRDMANRYKVTLTQAEREQLTELTRRGKSSAKKFVHARALLLCDAGEFGLGAESRRERKPSGCGQPRQGWQEAETKEVERGGIGEKV